MARSISGYPQELLAHGRYWFTTADVLDAFPDQQQKSVYRALGLLQQNDAVFSPAQGFYVVIPSEYRGWGVVPAEWFIDPLMVHAGRAYYVALLSAAAIHGAAHQSPQTFQVAVSSPTRNRDLGRIRLRFYQTMSIAKADTVKVTSHTGQFNAASKEMTLCDLAWRPKDAGGLSNVATIVREFPEVDTEKLARLAPLHGRSAVRRLGWLLHRFSPHDPDLHWLQVVAQPRLGQPALLDPGGGRRGHLDHTWNVRVNATVEPDL